MRFYSTAWSAEADIAKPDGSDLQDGVTTNDVDWGLAERRSVSEWEREAGCCDRKGDARAGCRPVDQKTKGDGVEDTLPRRPLTGTHLARTETGASLVVA